MGCTAGCRGAITSFVVASILVMVPTASFAGGHDCSLVKTEGVPTAEKNIQCLMKKIEALAGENAELKTQMQNPVTTTPSIDTFPSGAVVAFDLPDGCPKGWQADFSKGKGKFILGVGQGSLDYRGGNHQPDGVANSVELDEVMWNDQGGAEKIALNVRQMPEHLHQSIDNVFTALFDGDESVSDSTLGWKIVREIRDTSKAGLGEAHLNMPPYIALSFCKKE